MKSCDGCPNVSGSLSKGMVIKSPIAPGNIQESIPIDLEKNII